MRPTFVVCVALAVAACRGGSSGGQRGAGTTSVTQAGEVSPAVITYAEARQFFAPLPEAMLAPGLTRTPEQIALGRRLFYENVLSQGHNVSCNSCHALNAYGADGRARSFGSSGHTGGRNAPSVYNAAGQVAQFWDGRAATIEAQAKGPILNAVEMGMPDSAAVLSHMRASAEYRAAFAAAFPTARDPITYDNVARAIGAFERGLVTPSRWDRYVSGDQSALSADEQRGLSTFVRTGCSSCHNGAYVGGQMFAKLGAVKPWPTSSDSGRYAVTGNAADLFVFKVPSLRNVEKTGPYFHDGSVASLDSAIRLMARHQLGVELSDARVQDIHAWLASLTGELPAAYIAMPPQPAGRSR